MSQKTYEALKAHARKYTLLQSTLGLLEWDQETYMPKKGISLRSAQKELLTALSHNMRKDPKFKENLSALIDLKTGKLTQNNLEAPQKAALREWRRDLLQTEKQPDSLVSQIAQVTSKATHVWSAARAKNDFATFAPHLEEIVTLVRKQADCLGYDDHPYDALIDLYEPKMRVKHLDPIFETLKKGLKPLVDGLKKAPDRSFFYGAVDEAKQDHLCRAILSEMGVDFDRARLDLTSHPFCMGLSPSDLRLTMHRGSNNIVGNIMATLHEGGHGLYELGLPVEEYGTPLCQAASFGIHESQSRLWETRIGLSRPFWTHTYPKLQSTFPDKFSNIDFETFYSGVIAAEPSLIRVHSDELTYSLHIIVRYEIEKGLLDGSLQVKDLPERFAHLMQEYVGITPKTHAEGAMQDIHWAAGLIGYFPSYALGNIYAAQIFNAFETEFPDWEVRVGNGHMHFVRDYLNQTIHAYGRQFAPMDLIEKVTGSQLDVEPYIDHLTKRYGK